MMERAKLYGIGTLVLTIGLALLAFMVGVPPTYIAIGAVIIIGLGIMGAATKTKRSSSVHVDQS